MLGKSGIKLLPVRARHTCGWFKTCTIGVEKLLLKHEEIILHVLCDCEGFCSKAEY